MNRQSHIDGLRGLAASYVVLHHSYLEIWPLWRPASGLTASLTQWLLWGHQAVGLFIVISGYCLAMPVIRGGAESFSTLGFYRRRAMRILPPYYFGLALSVVLILLFIGKKTDTHWDVTLPISTESVAVCAALLPEFCGKVNHSYWSIGVECKIYLLFPLIVLLCRWIGVPGALLITSVPAFAIAFAHPTNFYVSRLVVQFLGLFCFGVAAAYIVYSEESLWKRLRGLPVWTLLWASASAAVVVDCWVRGLQDTIALDLVTGIAALAFFVAAGKAPGGRLCRVFGWKPFAVLGAFSYSLYLIHAPLIQVFWQYGIEPFDLSPQRQFVAVALTFPLIVACAWGFYLVCERPFIPRSSRPSELETTREN